MSTQQFSTTLTDVIRPLLFAYLHDGHPALDAVLSLLARIGRERGDPGLGGYGEIRPHVYVLQADPRRIAERCGPAVTVHDGLVDLADLLSRASLIIHHGGTGMSHEAVASGAAQLLLPLNLEQTITSRSLQALGVGLVVSPQPAQGNSAAYAAVLQDGVTRLLRPDVQAEARRRGEELRQSDFGDTLATIAETCRHLAGAPSP